VTAAAWTGDRPARGKLAIFMMQLRAPSETFIQKHIVGIAPGETVAVARLAGTQSPAPCPAFLADRWSLGLPVRLAARLGAQRRAQLSRAVGAFLRRNQVGYALGEYLDQFAEFVPLLNAMGLPYVVQGHGLDLSSSLRQPGVAESYHVYRSAQAILTRCEPHRRRLIDLGLPPEKVHVNPGGVDIPARTPDRGPDARRRLLAVGRMVPQKAPIKLLEAFRRAVVVDPKLTLDYVGGGPLFPAVREFVEACDLGEHVRLHGVATEAEKHRLLQVCGVFVQHSETDPETGDEEGLPAAIQEAMAYGLAVVSTRHAGIPEAVIEGESGILVDEGDVGAMADAFVDIAALAAGFGAAGAKRAAALYSWEQERDRLRGWLFGGTSRA
jgi:glycosyltransferase involved in cell wall biosynthesis